MSFHWNCFIVPLRSEICSFIVILVCLSLFYSIYEQYIYIYINVHVYVLCITIHLVRIWIYEDHCFECMY